MPDCINCSDTLAPDCAECVKQLRAENKQLKDERQKAMVEGGYVAWSDKIMSNLKAENTELRARLHRLGDKRLEESVNHCTLSSENRALKEQIQALESEVVKNVNG